MKIFIKKIPLAISGLMLALAAAGNLIGSYGPIYRNIFGAMSALVFLLILLKIIIYPNLVKEELKNPLVASVFPTFTMGTMLLSTYIRSFAPNLSFGIWILAIGGHLLLIIKFTLNYLLKFDLNKVFPSWFIVYVGIVVGSVSAPAFKMESLGKLLFWIGLGSYFILVIPILKRVLENKIPQAAQPSLAIFAAPLSLCLAGYMSSFENKNILMLWGLLILSQFTYFLVLIRLPKIIDSGFYPSFSALTFPLVISAISIKMTVGFLIEIEKSFLLLNYLVRLEEIIGILIIAYVGFKYIEFLFVPIKEAILE